MFRVVLMRVCSPSDAMAMAHHLLDPTASPELAEDLSSYGVERRDIDLRSGVRLRPDLDPGLRALYEIGPDWSEPKHLAGLLAGTTALGNPIRGMASRRPWQSLSEALGFPRDRLPTYEELALVASGRRADGDVSVFSEDARKKAFALYGLPHDLNADDSALHHMAEGRRFDGRSTKPTWILEQLTVARNVPIAALHVCISAAKSLSVAFGLRDGPERAILYNAHKEAVADTMRVMEAKISQIRRGDGGRLIVPASTAWFGLTHFTSRPVGVDRAGRPMPDAVPRRGDVQIHEHVIWPIVALPDDGVPGKIDTLKLHGEIKALGAYYHWRTAVSLRRSGIAVELHPTQNCVRVSDVPLPLEKRFSKRTVIGTEQAAAFAASLGFDLADLDDVRRSALIKQGVQNPRGAKRDDVADLNSWTLDAEESGLSVPCLVRQVNTVREPDDLQLERARTVGVERIESAISQGRRMGSRTAAILGLLATGSDQDSDIERVVIAIDAIRPDPAADSLNAGRNQEPIDETTIRRKSIDGSAILVPQGPEAVAAAAAAIWITGRLSHGIAYPIQVATHDAVTKIELAARRVSRDEGLLGDVPRPLRVRGPNGDVCRIDLFVGDSIFFTADVNGRSGMCRGRVGSTGSSATIVAHNDKGIDVKTMLGPAFVSWRALFDPRDETMALRLGYAAIWPCRSGSGGVAAILEGSWNAIRLGVAPDTRIVFDEDLEMTHGRNVSRNGDAAERDIKERLWASIGANLSRARRGPWLDELDGLRRKATAVRLSLRVIAERSGLDPEVGVVDGVPHMRKTLKSTKDGRGTNFAKLPTVSKERERPAVSPKGLADVSFEPLVGHIDCRPTNERTSSTLGVGRNAASAGQPLAQRPSAKARDIANAVDPFAHSTLFAADEEEDIVLDLDTTPRPNAIARIRDLASRLKRFSLRQTLTRLVATLELTVSTSNQLADAITLAKSLSVRSPQYPIESKQYQGHDTLSPTDCNNSKTELRETSAPMSIVMCEGPDGGTSPKSNRPQAKPRRAGRPVVVAEAGRSAPATNMVTVNRAAAVDGSHSCAKAVAEHINAHDEPATILMPRKKKGAPSKIATRRTRERKGRER